MAEKTSRVKYWIGQLHLWLGFSSGIVVFIVALTGCIYAFQYEIQELTQSYRHVERQDKSFLLPTTLRSIADKELPGKKIHAVMYEGPERAAMAIFYHYSETEQYYYNVYLNPYTGEVLKVKDMYGDFFYQVLMGHFYLWLPEQIGQPIVATATLIFVAMLVTGLILWWPKRNKTKQRFTIKWNARWRRKNYDLHNVLGFYITSIAVILAVTGLVWGFQWFAQSYYWAISGGETIKPYEEPKSSISSTVRVESPVDKIWLTLSAAHPTAEAIEVHFPETDSASIGAGINPDRTTYWKVDYRYYDQYSLEELPVDHMYGRFDKASTAEKIYRMNYDIHTGAVLGIAGKVLAFLASLVAASLPITGFLIWYGRRNKVKKEQRKASIRAKTPARKEVPVLEPSNSFTSK